MQRLYPQQSPPLREKFVCCPFMDIQVVQSDLGRFWDLYLGLGFGCQGFILLLGNIAPETAPAKPWIGTQNIAPTTNIYQDNTLCIKGF